jgi:hypothetical protein
LVFDSEDNEYDADEIIDTLSEDFTFTGEGSYEAQPNWIYIAELYGATNGATCEVTHDTGTIDLFFIVQPFLVDEDSDVYSCLAVFTIWDAYEGDTTELTITDGD